MKILNKMDVRMNAQQEAFKGKCIHIKSVSLQGKALPADGRVGFPCIYLAPGPRPKAVIYHTSIHGYIPLLINTFTGLTSVGGGVNIIRVIL